MNKQTGKNLQCEALRRVPGLKRSLQSREASNPRPGFGHPSPHGALGAEFNGGSKRVAFLPNSRTEVPAIWA
jgi:hypothetical protein